MKNSSAIKYLKFFHGFVKFAKVMTLLAIFITIISSIYNYNQIEIPISYQIPEAGKISFNDLGERPVLIKEGNGILKYQATDDAQFTSMAAFNILFNIAAAFAIYFIYFFLEKVIKSAIDKKPFSIENANSMQKLGYLFIGYGTFSSIYHIAGLLFIGDSFYSEIIQQESFNMLFLKNTIELLFNKRTLLGFFALLISLMLKYGIELKQETELTI